jgi:hypothetical protein
MASKAESNRAAAILETYGAKMRTIVFDPKRLTPAGEDEINHLRQTYWGEKILQIAVPLEHLQDLYIFAAPDQLARYEAGFPIVIAPVLRDDRVKNPKHRPTDTVIVKEAKNALAVEAFRLAGRQKAVELAGKTHRLNLTPAAAEDRAKAVVAEAMWRGGRDPDDDKKKSRVAGLIDRGRRLAARFFGTQKPIDRWRREARDVEERVNADGRTVLPLLEADNRERAKGMAWNEERARDFSGGMSRWNTAVVTNKPIDPADGVQVTNALEPRMTAPALMKVAISGNFDPAAVHKNLLWEQKKFEVGALLGRLDRGGAIELAPEHAAILKRAVETVRREQCETHADACDWQLIEAAARSYPPEFWTGLLDRVLASGNPETVMPKNRSQAEEN